MLAILNLSNFGVVFSPVARMLEKMTISGYQISLTASLGLFMVTFNKGRRYAIHAT